MIVATEEMGLVGFAALSISLANGYQSPEKGPVGLALSNWFLSHAHTL